VDMTYTPEQIEFRREVREWIQRALPAPLKRKAEGAGHYEHAEIMQWHKILYAKGWIAPHWPKEVGGTGWDITRRHIFGEETVRANVPILSPFGLGMVGPLLIQFGTDEQKRRFLPDILHTNVWWCQGYSEPGSGSDLASLRTKAEDNGDHFVVNGVKTWTTMAQYADWMFCLVRTSQEAKQQLGISFLLIDMRSPGVTVKPIITLDQPRPDFHEINMVYLENVVVPKENLVGEVGKGWTCAKYLLEFERGNAYSPSLKGVLAQIRGMAALEQDGTGRSMSDDPAFEARLDDVEVQVLAMEFTEFRILGALAAGTNVGPESSLLKTRGTELQQTITELAMEVSGHYALPFDASTPYVDDPFEPIGPTYANGVAQEYFNARKVSIYAGSNEIQRNIMAKLVLGLG